LKRECILLFAGALIAGAQGRQGPELPAAKPLEVPQRVGILSSTNLTLDDVIARVLTNNRDIAVQRFARDESPLNVKAAQGYFDPQTGFTAYRQRSVTPVTSLLGGAANGKLTQSEYLADPFVSGIFQPTGSTYKLDFSSAKQTSDNQFVSLNPQFPTSINLSVTQPLWRGLLFDTNRHRLAVARKNVALSDAQFRQTVINSVSQAVQDYYELEYAYTNLNVQIEAVRLAEQQDASNRRQVQQGLLAPADVIQTQTQIATFQQNVFLAQQTLTNAEDALKALLTSDRNDPIWTTALVPQHAEGGEERVPTLETAITTALKSRPEIAEAALSIDVNRLDLRLARVEAKPQVDFVATASLNGLSGRVLPSQPNPLTSGFVALGTEVNELAALAGLPPIPPLGFGSVTVPPIFVGGYSQSLSALTTGTFPTVTIGLNVSIPIRNRTAKANAAIALLEAKRLAAQKQQVELAVVQDVRNAVQGLSSAHASLKAAANAHEYAEEQYASEQRQFRAGTSTVFLVLQRQTDLVAARTREVRARADLAEAEVNLQRAMSTTLEKRNVNLQTP
jgi:HAE1 family hydrophobic/amphiphilic exporter-1